MTAADAEHALRDAVIHEPDDDAPRLAYSDWLEERGDVRGEFIRLQIKLSRKDCPECEGRDNQVGPCGLTNYFRDCYTCKALRMRERELLDAHGADWFRAARGMAKGAPIERNAWCYRSVQSMGAVRFWLGFCRGFLGLWDGTCQDWLAHAGAMCDAQPVEAVSLSDRQPGIEDGEYFWTDASDPGRAALFRWSSLPWRLYGLLQGDGLAQTIEGFMYYDRKENALADLAQACVAFGRREATASRRKTKQGRRG